MVIKCNFPPVLRYCLTGFIVILQGEQKNVKYAQWRYNGSKNSYYSRKTSLFYNHLSEFPDLKYTAGKSDRLIFSGESDKFRFSVFEYSIIPEAAVTENLCRFIKGKRYFFRRVGVCSHSNDLAAKLAVTADHSSAGIGLSKSIMITACIQFDSDIFTDQCAKYFVQNILISFITCLLYTSRCV